MAYQHIKVPSGGEKIRVRKDFSLEVPERPIIPYIEGDGTGVDITPVMLKVVDAAVQKAYGGAKKIIWMEMFAGEKSCRVYGENVWLPDETLQASKDFVVSIKGPLTTPVGGGIRSINVALRQELDLYVCLRPVRWFKGVPSPLKKPDDVDMVIFRENAEDIYAGIEWPAKSAEAKKVIDFLVKEMKVKKIRFPDSSAIGIKPVSIEGSERLIRKAYQYAIDNKRKSVTLVHKGNIQKFTEAGLRDPVSGDDAAPHGLGGGRRRHHPIHGNHDSGQDRDLRLRAADGGRQEGFLLRLRPGDDRAHVARTCQSKKAARGRPFCCFL